MKICIFVLSFLIFGSHYLQAETVTQKVDRSANEAIDEIKSASKTIVRKLKKNTNSEKDSKAENKNRTQRREGSSREKPL